MPNNNNNIYICVYIFPISRRRRQLSSHDIRVRNRVQMQPLTYRGSGARAVIVDSQDASNRSRGVDDAKGGDEVLMGRVEPRGPVPFVGQALEPLKKRCLFRGRCTTPMVFRRLSVLLLLLLLPAILLLSSC